jgi:ankyrin repeat protein
VQVLLAAGADPTARDESRRTPLHVAAWCAETEPVDADQIEVVRMLLAAGCDPDCEDGSGATPLIRAASQPELVRVLLDAGVDPARPTGSELWDAFGLSAMHYAALAPWAPGESLRLMLDRVTDPDIRTATGLTPLHCAIRRGQVGPVEVLVQAGADANARLNDPHGLQPGLRSHTPISIARELGHHHVTAFLSNMGATGDGTSP